MENKVLTLTLIAFLCLGFNSSSAQQKTVKGILLDSESHQPIAEAIIRGIGETGATVSASDGAFVCVIPETTEAIEILHISYNSLIISIKPNAENSFNLGNIFLVPKFVELNEVNVFSSYVTDRNTPVAFSSVKARTIEQKLGNQDFPEILKMTPGVYATKEGGGSGDDRLTLRGFQQENIALLLNGVPVSSMENGLVYWSNWAGLADATETIQVQRGLGASRSAMNSVGGTVNIITKSTKTQPGGSLRYSLSDYGNRKTILSFSTGKMKNGASLLFLGSRTTGPGYVNATYVDGWAYFLSISKEFSIKHKLVFTAMGSPEKHGQHNYGISKSEFDANGIKYNNNWGFYNGKILSLSENFYHKPQLNLNHYWNISPKVFLATSAYVSFGTGGGRYTEAFNYGPSTWSFTKNAQIDFDHIYLNNSTHGDSATLADGSIVRGFSKNILTLYRADHYWAGLLSSLSFQVNEDLKITSGLHVRKFKSHLYEVVDDLLGGDFWVEQYAWSLVGVHGRNQEMKPGDIINVDNYSMMNYGNIFGQAEYKQGGITAFAAASASGTTYSREDPYNYPENPLSITIRKPGFDTKAGISTSLGGNGNLYLNTGYYSREPYYKFVFVNYSNVVASNLANEKIAAAELGYSFENQATSARINVYYTYWKDKSILSRENIQLTDNTLSRSLVRGLNALHRGIEAEFSLKICPNFNVSTTASLGDWKWLNDVAARIYDDKHVLVENVKIYTKGLRIGDAPQTQLGVSMAYQMDAGLRFAADWVYYDRLYANFDPVNRIEATDRQQPYRIPAYGLFDLYAGYDLKMKELPVSLQIACQNVMNNETIIRGVDGASHQLDTFRGFWSLGRTFNFSAKLSF